MVSRKEVRDYIRGCEDLEDLEELNRLVLNQMDWVQSPDRELNKGLSSDEEDFVLEQARERRLK